MPSKSRKIEDYFSVKQHSFAVSSQKGDKLITSKVGVQLQQKMEVTQSLYKDACEMENLSKLTRQKNQSTTEEGRPVWKVQKCKQKCNNQLEAF